MINNSLFANLIMNIKNINLLTQLIKEYPDRNINWDEKIKVNGKESNVTQHLLHSVSLLKSSEKQEDFLDFLFDENILKKDNTDLLNFMIEKLPNYWESIIKEDNTIIQKLKPENLQQILKTNNFDLIKKIGSSGVDFFKDFNPFLFIQIEESNSQIFKYFLDQNKIDVNKKIFNKKNLLCYLLEKQNSNCIYSLLESKQINQTFFKDKDNSFIKLFSGITPKIFKKILDNMELENYLNIDNTNFYLSQVKKIVEETPYTSSGVKKRMAYLLNTVTKKDIKPEFADFLLNNLYGIYNTVFIESTNHFLEDNKDFHNMMSNLIKLNADNPDLIKILFTLNNTTIQHNETHEHEVFDDEDMDCMMDVEEHEIIQKEEFDYAFKRYLYFLLTIQSLNKEGINFDKKTITKTIRENISNLLFFPIFKTTNFNDQEKIQALSKEYFKILKELNIDPYVADFFNILLSDSKKKAKLFIEMGKKTPVKEFFNNIEQLKTNYSEIYSKIFENKKSFIFKNKEVIVFFESLKLKNELTEDFELNSINSTKKRI